jgi:hypothetical protein
MTGNVEGGETSPRKSRRMAASDPTERRSFTVAAANQTLPLVRAIVQDIVVLYGDVTERKRRLAGLRKRNPRDRGADPYREEVEQIKDELDKDVARLEGYVAELSEIGIELKDPAAGVVDFPTQMDGESAFLCWQLGETEVQFWHGAQVGVAGKQPLQPRTGNDHIA